MSKRSLQMPLGEGYEDPQRTKTTTMSEVVLSKSNEVDAIPTSDKYEEDEYDQRDPVRGTALLPVARTAEYYNTSHPKRGICLVFNQEAFEGRMSNRRGSSTDVHRIKTTFSRLGFEIIIHNDLEYHEMMREIENITEMDHSDSDCLCIFVLTHGINDDYLFAKDAAYKPDKIWRNFSADKCPTLAAKPKLFFIEASRGSRIDEGVTLIPHSHSIHQTRKENKLVDGIRLMKISENSQPDAPLMSYKIPTPSDFLIAHSCAEGYASWRNVMKGTWYVQTLCKVIDEYAESTDLLRMLTITARIVATDFESDSDPSLRISGKKQMPSITSTLTRDLYFTLKDDLKTD